MTLYLQFSALLKKNFILMKRNICSSCCLVIFPIFMLAIISAIKNIISNDEIAIIGSDLEYIANYSTIYPTYNNNTYKNTEADSNYQGLTIRDPFYICDRRNSTIIAYFKGTDSLTDRLKQKILEIRSDMSFIEFETQQEMFDSVEVVGYGSNETEYCFGFSILKESSKKFSYSLNYFSPSQEYDDDDFVIDIPSTIYDPLSPFTSTPQMDLYDLWKESGYVFIMNQINNIILKETVNKDVNNDNYRLTAGILPMKYPDYEDDKSGQLIEFTVPFFLIVIYMIPMILFVYRMVGDKETKVKEGMKIMGMKDLAYFLSYFIQYLIINLIIAIVGSIILSGTLEYTAFGIRFLMLFLFGLTVFGLIYIFQSFIDKSAIAMIISIMIYYILFFVASAIDQDSVGHGVKMAGSLLSPTCLQLGISTISYFEKNNLDLTFDLSDKDYKEYSVSDMLVMLFIDFLIYMFIGFYLDNVMTHEFGTSKPWYFLFTSNYWCGSKDSNSFIKRKSSKVENSRDSFECDNIHFQDEANYKSRVADEQILKIRNIKKTFGDGKTALNGVSFNLYKNEIFALLGHNGAGKSTLINILTGLYEATEGRVMYDGKDILKNQDYFRQKIGICPQHDVLFSELTVKEHLDLFSHFKGNSDEKEINDQSKKILMELELENQIDQKAGSLSGGQKRKLSIAISLLGNSEIIFLDEPSSGMDISNRRKLWDILKRFTKDRIIVLTTHYMEEASVLGKRIGIVSHGKMKCSGTSLFLINKFGQHISLTLIKQKSKESNEKINKGIIKFIKTNFSENSVNHKSKSLEFEELSEEILVKIPKNNDQFKLDYKTFFENLDKNLDNLQLKTYSASMPTLEDVFLITSDDFKKEGKIEKFLDAQNNDNNSNTDNKLNNNNEIVETVKLSGNKKQISFVDFDPSKTVFPSGFAKFASNFKWCFIKRYFQGIRNKKIFIMEIICPVIIVIIGLALSEVEFVYDPPSRLIQMSNYPFLQETMVTQTPYKNREINLNTELIQLSSRVTYDFNTDVNDNSNSLVSNLADFTNDVLNKYNATHVADSEYNDTITGEHLGSYFFSEYDKTNHVYEFISVLNPKASDAVITFTQYMFTNLINKINQVEDITIEFNNNPFPLTNFQRNKANSANTSNLVFFAGIGIALIPASFITFIVKELQSTRHLQIISGVNYLAYWTANFCFEYIKFFIAVGLILIFIAIFDKYESWLWLLSILLGFGLILLTYACAFMFKKEATAQNFIILLLFIVGALGGSLVVIFRLFDDLADIAKGIAYIFRICPLFAWANGYSVMLTKVSLFYVDNPDAIIYEEIDLWSFDYLAMDVTYLIIFIPIYILIIYIIEMLRSSWVIGKYKPNEPNYDGIIDNEVKNEIIKANNKNLIDPENGRQNQLAISVKNVEKTYDVGCCDKPVQALRNISFTLEYGECFAMLGLSGAGKSTMFSCLTQKEFPEKGSITINGKTIDTGFEQSRSLLGYCPQFDAIFEEMTVLENLNFYASIKGIPDDIKNDIVMSIINEMNLSSYIHKISGNLSGGNKRKLSVAIAMVGNPPIILLDEPSAGMDPEARRFMWSVIHKVTKQKKQSSVILTTHSMEEAETLCSKLGIMVKGQFKCMGSSSVIKSNYGTGYEVFLTVNYIPNELLQQNARKCKINNLSEDTAITREEAKNILHLIESDLSTDLLVPDNIGYEIDEELRKYNTVKLSSLLNWNYAVSSIYQIINGLLESFPEVELTEYWGNTFQMKIPKKDDITIGYLFGYFDTIKDKCNISEYTISQTSMEQIFNTFANQEDEDEKSLVKNKKQSLKFSKTVLQRSFSKEYKRRNSNRESINN